MELKYVNKCFGSVFNHNDLCCSCFHHLGIYKNKIINNFNITHCYMCFICCAINYCYIVILIIIFLHMLSTIPSTAN